MDMAAYVHEPIEPHPVAASRAVGDGVDPARVPGMEHGPGAARARRAQRDVHRAAGVQGAGGLAPALTEVAAVLKGLGGQEGKLARFHFNSRELHLGQWDFKR